MDDRATSEAVTKTMNLFPAFLKLSGRPCLVVGAGKVAEEKIGGLLGANAQVLVVAPEASGQVRRWARARRIRWEARRFRAADLRGVFLVVAATSSPELHKKIYRLARRKRVLCNAVDDPDNCDFYYGSVVRRGALQIAISTAGLSPALAQRLRKKLESEFGEEYGEWVQGLGRARKKLFRRKMELERRNQLLHGLASEASFEKFVKRSKHSGSKGRKD